MTEYTYVKLSRKASNPARPTVGEKPGSFAAFSGDKRLFHLTREGDTLRIESADPRARYRIVEVPWSQVEYAERPLPKAEPAVAPQKAAGGR
jgi:hypothetical protein